MDVLSLDQLTFAAPPGKRLAVLGDPVGHSLSPAMHNAALAEMAVRDPGLAAWRYAAIHVPGPDLGRALPLLHREGVAGINLTIPHKVSARDLVEAVDPEVEPMGAVNTLIRTESGYRATNTDGYGINRAVEEAFSLRMDGLDIWLFGAGGAARGIIVACLQAGCARLTVLNRSEERLRELEAQLVRSGLAGLDRLRLAGLETAPRDAEAGSLLINATSLGLRAEDPNPVDPAYLEPGRHVYDTTYGSRNRLRSACAERGVAYADGLSMLVWQGVRSLEIWTGRPVPAETMRRAALARLEEKDRV